VTDAPSHTATVRHDAARKLTRIGIGAGMILAGVGHLSFARRQFQAQVPDWVPVDKDATVLASGVVEIAVGTALVTLPRHQQPIGAGLAAFLVAVFSGNLSQYTNHRDGLGLNTDRKRFIRLFFQPLMIGAAWWATRQPRPRLAGPARHSGVQISD
jgi:uncharacterized membrane protein